MTSKTFIAATVLSIHQPMLSERVRECGTLFRFETHSETSYHGVGLLVTCLCPEGHGVAKRKWSGWLEPQMGRYDLLVLPEPTQAPVAPVATVAAPIAQMPRPMLVAA